MIKGCLLVTLVAGVAAAERSGEIKLSGANGPLFRGEASTKGTEKTGFPQGKPEVLCLFFWKDPMSLWSVLATLRKNNEKNASLCDYRILKVSSGIFIMMPLRKCQALPNEVMPLGLVDCRYFGASLTQQNQWLLRHTPAFSAREVGYWDQDKVLLTVQMISTVQIYAGVLS